MTADNNKRNNNSKNHFLYSYGGDSLAAMRFVQLVREKIQVNIPIGM